MFAKEPLPGGACIGSWDRDWLAFTIRQVLSLSERWPTIVHALVFDLAHRLHVHAVLAGDGFARFLHAHVLVLSNHQGGEQFSPLFLSQFHQ